MGALYSKPYLDFYLKSIMAVNTHTRTLRERERDREREREREREGESFKEPKSFFSV